MERKGICKNVGVCTMANKVQTITDDDADFVCPECGEPLEEYKEEVELNEKKSLKLPIIIGGVIGALIGVFFALKGNPKEPVVVPVDSTVAVDTNHDTTVTSNTEVDTVVQGNTTTITEKTSTKTVVNTTSTQSKSVGNGTLSLSYGKYSGATKKGYAHGQGRLTYTTTRVINRNDIKQRTAQAGDYVIGEFYNGFVVYGKHYNAAGELLESLNFGVGSESSYDSK